jgi:hypothetical protein
LVWAGQTTPNNAQDDMLEFQLINFIKLNAAFNKPLHHQNHNIYGMQVL